ncbi:MAG: response regulator transcription factor [Deltaproteobacteria bacterium]|nr:response regulator transcription factor [Deltaproteobacteria bacterium]
MWISKSEIGNVKDRRSNPEALTRELAPITAQERKVLGLIAEALTNKEIAVALEISPATVKRHLENILRKLELKNRVDAAIFAVRNGHALSKTGRNGVAA